MTLSLSFVLWKGQLIQTMTGDIKSMFFVLLAIRRLFGNINPQKKCD